MTPRLLQPAAFPPEIDLLFACARRTMEEADRIAATKAIERGIDWAGFVPVANKHGMLPLVAHHLGTGALDPSAVPMQCQDSIRARNAAIARRCLFLTNELVTLVCQFADAGIRVVPLKGPLLAQLAYGSVALRSYSDLDLLCVAADHRRAIALLHDLGYGADAWTRAVDPATLARVEARRQDIALLHPTATFAVELHRAFLHPRWGQEYSLDAFASRLQPTMFMGTPVLVLSPEDLLSYLCMHGAKHAWRRIEWLASVAELIRAGVVRDWERVVDVARAHREETRLRTTLEAARLLLRAPVPDALIHHTRRTRTGMRAIVRNLAASSAGDVSPRSIEVNLLRTDDNLWQSLVRGADLMLNPNLADLAAVRLPAPLLPLYSLVRPVRVVFRALVGRSA